MGGVVQGPLLAVQYWHNLGGLGSGFSRPDLPAQVWQGIAGDADSTCYPWCQLVMNAALSFWMIYFIFTKL